MIGKYVPRGVLVYLEIRSMDPQFIFLFIMIQNVEARKLCGERKSILL
jgi:hypothetical protein